MKIEEIRIGNIVTDRVYVGIVCVISNDKCVIKHKSGIVKCKIEDLHPIELTEEWLLRLGFKPFVKDFALKGIIIHKRKIGWVLRKSVPEIKYVHQLQNLYFALKGEELKWN